MDEIKIGMGRTGRWFGYEHGGVDADVVLLGKSLGGGLPLSAIVARNGALARISLRDGSILAIAEDAYPEARASCHAVRLCAGIGFVCGEREAATVIYEHNPPLGMRPIMRFDKPRFVSASGIGALVIRGRCDGDDSFKAFLGASADLVRNIHGVAPVAELDGDEVGYLVAKVAEIKRRR